MVLNLFRKFIALSPLKSRNLVVLGISILTITYLLIALFLLVTGIRSIDKL